MHEETTQYLCMGRLQVYVVLVKKGPRILGGRRWAATGAGTTPLGGHEELSSHTIRIERCTRILCNSPRVCSHFDHHPNFLGDIEDTLGEVERHLDSTPAQDPSVTIY